MNLSEKNRAKRKEEDMSRNRILDRERKRRQMERKK